MGASVFMASKTLNPQISLNSVTTEVAHFTPLNAGPPLLLEDDTQILRENTHSLQELTLPPLLDTKELGC